MVGFASCKPADALVYFLCCFLKFLDWLIFCCTFTLIITQHHSTRYVDAAYCYRPSSVICLSVCHRSKPCKNGWNNRDAIWNLDLGKSFFYMRNSEFLGYANLMQSKEACIRWRCILAPPGKYHWTVHVRQWHGLLSTYFDYLLPTLMRIHALYFC